MKTEQLLLALVAVGALGAGAYLLTRPKPGAAPQQAPAAPAPQQVPAYAQGPYPQYTTPSAPRPPAAPASGFEQAVGAVGGAIQAGVKLFDTISSLFG